MKSTCFVMALVFAILSSCNNGTSKPKDTNSSNMDSGKVSLHADSPAAISIKIKNMNSIKSITASYFDLKNALANDDGNAAADAGKVIMEEIDITDTSSLSIDQRKLYIELGGDIRENAEHISTNASKIAHQREHFEMLSKDIYDLIKTTGTGQTAYRDFCPMYNNGKGAYWISEIKEIRNPYLGKKMATCGIIKSQIN